MRCGDHAGRRPETDARAGPPLTCAAMPKDTDVHRHDPPVWSDRGARGSPGSVCPEIGMTQASCLFGKFDQVAPSRATFHQVPLFACNDAIAHLEGIAIILS
ncbi:hypothetical protein C357_14966 [Citreicella sp. 357]|nr:hypothetical protein C357_14966 [Citreicella sp. 357]